jgi:tRNA threonylcarbamoyladenosine biosynthesis protein TsaB
MILAIDTSTQMLGLALYDGSCVLLERVWKSQRHHTIELASAVQAALQESGIQIDKLKVLAVAIGPGSFTSLRIGVVFTKGLSLALHLPVIGVPTLDILAYAQPVKDNPLICVLQAGREKLAISQYHNEQGQWVSDEPSRVITTRELEAEISFPTLVCGELSEEDRHILSRKWKSVLLISPANSLRRPAYLAELACKRWKENHVDDPISLSPIYLHTIDSIPG